MRDAAFCRSSDTQPSGHVVSVSFCCFRCCFKHVSLFLQIAQAVGVDNDHSVRNMFPNREQFGRPIGPMTFAINASRNPPLPPPPPPIFALPAQHPIHQSPCPSHTASNIRGRMDTDTPTTGQFLLAQLPTFTTVHRITDIGVSPLFTHSGRTHPASIQPAHDTEPDDNTPEPGIPRRRGTLGCQSQVWA